MFYIFHESQIPIDVGPYFGFRFGSIFKVFWSSGPYFGFPGIHFETKGRKKGRRSKKEKEIDAKMELQATQVHTAKGPCGPLRNSRIPGFQGPRTPGHQDQATRQTQDRIRTLHWCPMGTVADT